MKLGVQMGTYTLLGQAMLKCSQPSPIISNVTVITKIRSASFGLVLHVQQRFLQILLISANMLINLISPQTRVNRLSSCKDGIILRFDTIPPHVGHTDRLTDDRIAVINTALCCKNSAFERHGGIWQQKSLYEWDELRTW